MDLKEQIIHEYLLGYSTYVSLAEKYQVSRATINRWVMDFSGRPRSKSRELKTVNLGLMKKATSPTDPTFKAMSTLEKELEAERLKNKLLNAMIDIAEDDLKISIRKKFGTKPLKK